MSRVRSRVLVPGQGNAGGRPEATTGSPIFIFRDAESGAPLSHIGLCEVGLVLRGRSGQAAYFGSCLCGGGT